MHRNAGYSIFELLTTLMIVGILAIVSLPHFGQLILDQQGKALINDLARTLNFARSAAITHGRMVTMCPSRNGLSCGGLWLEGMLVFTDNNADRIVNGKDEVLRHFVPGQVSGKSRGTLTLRSFPNRQYLQFTSLGFANNQNGTITWCPPDSAPALIQQVVFSKSGRARLAYDSDGDGIREGTDGKPLVCQT